MAKSPEYYDAQTEYLQQQIYGINLSLYQNLQEKSIHKTTVVASVRRDERKEIYSKYGRNSVREYEKAKQIRQNIVAEKKEKDTKEILSECKNQKDRIQVLREILRGKCDAHSAHRKHGNAFKY
jgi:hypothetical protein